MYKLPHWVITDRNPAFYDSESATAIEQTAKVYKAFQDMVDDYNLFVDRVNESVEEFETGIIGDIDTFCTAFRQEFQDFIDVVNLKYLDQENRYVEVVKELQAMVREVETNLDTFLDEKIGILNEHITNKTLVFDSNATNKTKDFDTHYAELKAELQAYIESEAVKFNVDSLIDEYNDNAAAKTVEFDEHLAAEQAELETYIEEQKQTLSVTSLVEEYNTNAAEKTAELETLISTAKTDYNNNALSKTTSFNKYVSDAHTEFDEYHEGKEAEFNAHVAGLLQEIDQRAEDRIAEIGGADNTSILKNLIMNTFFHVGSYFETSSTPTQFNPNIDWGGEWVLDSAGRVTVGVDLDSEKYNVPGMTGGAETVTLTTAQMPAHKHTATAAEDSHTHTYKLPPPYGSAAGAGSAAWVTDAASGTYAAASSTWTSHKTGSDKHTHTITVAETGGGESHENMMPYVTVYRWHRIA